MSQPKHKTYAAFLVIVQKEGCYGGHIRSRQHNGSLCGIEKRLPDRSHEIDFDGEGDGPESFAHWFKTNELWICKLCLRIYRRETKTPAPE